MFEVFGAHVASILTVSYDIGVGAGTAGMTPEMSSSTPSSPHPVRVVFNLSLQIVHRHGYYRSLTGRSYFRRSLGSVGSTQKQVENNAPDVLPEVASSLAVSRPTFSARSTSTSRRRPSSRTSASIMPASGVPDLAVH